MQLTAIPPHPGGAKGGWIKTIRTMQLVSLLMLGFCLQVAATGVSQTVTYTGKNVPLVKVLAEVKQQTGYLVTYKTNQVRNTAPVTIQANQVPLTKFLEQVLSTQSLDFTIESNTIFIKRKAVSAPLPVPMEQAEAAPPRELKGRVLNENNEGLAGVSVMIKGSNRGTVTDANGAYALLIADGENPNPVLEFSFVGYEIQSVQVGAQSNHTIKLVKASAGLSDVVVVGYGTQKKVSVTAAVSSIKGDEINAIPITNVSNSFGGRLSGVVVKQSSGEPGKDGSSIFIRGVSTIGSPSALTIVDGIPRGFQHLDPNSIESITILKDAAAVAPYGVAGANGVILITTKRGKSGAPSLNYNGYIGFQNPTVLPKYVSNYQYAQLRNTIADNEGLPKPYSADALRKLQDGSDPDAFPVDDYLGSIVKKNALLHYHNVEITGGTDKVKYYAGLGYQNQAGMWPSTNSQRYNLSMSLDADVTATTKVSLSINGWVKNSEYPAATTEGIFETIGYTHLGNGGQPLVFSNGMPGRLIMQVFDKSAYRKENSKVTMTQLSLTQKIPFVPGLELRGTVAYDMVQDTYKGWGTPFRTANIDTTQRPYVITLNAANTKPALAQTLWESAQATFQTGFNYNRNFGAHGLALTGVFEAKANNANSMGVSRRNYNLYIDEVSMGSSSTADMTTSGTSTAGRQVGLVYRMSYNFKSKYLLETSGRYDGHYYFAPDKRFGFFPAVSAGWRLSEENFIKNNFDWLTNLKIRASYGEVGALAGAPFQYLRTYDVDGPGYSFGGNGVQIVGERSEPNINITWERAKKSDIGIEGTLFNGLFSFEADYFYEKRSNMLVSPDVTTPVEYGVGISQVNAGVMENKGIDLSATLSKMFSKNVFVSIRGTFTYTKNRLLQVFENPVTFNNPNRRLTGRPLGTQFGFKAIGYFQEDDFDVSGAPKFGIPTQPWEPVQPGDVRYADLNEDGRITLDDLTVIGNADFTPRIIYGFSPSVKVRNWSVDLLFQGAAKTNLYHCCDMSWPFFNGMNVFEDNLDYWTPENTNAKHPRITSAPVANNTQTSSLWMRNASYLRLKNLTIGYTLSPAIMRRIRMQSARIYVSGQNLITWTEMINWDPESHRKGYPQQKVVSIGFNIGF